MEITTVSIEHKNLVESSLYRQSGTMLNQKYVITTANMFLAYFRDDCHKHYEQIASITSLYTNLTLPKDTLNVIWRDPKETTKYIVKKAEILGVFHNKTLQRTCRQVLQDWTVDSAENSSDLSKILSLFFVLKLEESCNEDDFKQALFQLWENVQSESLCQGDEILVKSCPFGNRAFLDSYSKGIVSNVLGEKSCLIVSDCPTTPGSEGSGVFKVNSSKRVVLVGLVLSACCWWRKDWTGLTLVVDLRAILAETLQNTKIIFDAGSKIESNHLINTMECSLLQVYRGARWGTAILLNKDQGILITNAHVLDADTKEVKLYWKGQSFDAVVLYRASDTELDLAILKSYDANLLESSTLKSIKISSRSLDLGEEVYIAGFAVFSRRTESDPSLTKGNVAQLDETMIKTTCCVNPGMSGGAIMNTSGELVGVVVCNVKIKENGAVFPRLNIGIPYFPFIEQCADGDFTKDKSKMTALQVGNLLYLSKL